MTRTPPRLRAIGIVLLGLVLGSSAPARAQDDALNKVKDLNTKAVEAYENLDPEEARKFLLQGLEVCAAEGLNKHPLKARTHVNLGVILVGGLKQRDAGIKQFRRALEIDPSIIVPKRLSNPEIQAAFEEAQKEAAAGGDPSVAAADPVKPEDTAKPGDPASTGTKPEGPAPGGPPTPATVKGVYHEPVTEAKPGEALSVKAIVEAALGADRVVLAYRPEGASDFLARDMEPDASGWHAARIPEPAMGGNSVAYYIEARKGGQAVSNNGTATEPHVVSLGGAGRGISQANSGEDPNVSASGRTGSADGAGKVWLSVGIGGGGGYVSGTPEVNPHYVEGTEKRPIKFASTATAQLLHLSPELGYFVSERLMVSLQGRLQMVSGATEVKHDSCRQGNGVCKPASGAIAVLGRVTYLLGEPGPFRPYVAASVGGGDIRYLVDVSAHHMDCGPNMNQSCVDTVRGGRIFLGPSAGFTYTLSDAVFFNGALNVLLGAPNTAFNVDLNVGLGLKL